VSCQALEIGDFYEPGGWIHIAGLATKRALESVCTNQSAGKMLWAESERAVGEWKL